MEVEVVSTEAKRKGFAPGNKLGGRKKGSIGKYTEGQLRRLLAVIGANDEKIIKKVVQVALTDDHKEQGTCLKLLMERLVPATKAIEISGLGGKELALRVIVEGIESIRPSLLENKVVEDATLIE